MSESEDCNHTVIQEEHAMVVHHHRRYGKGSPTHLTLLVRSYPHNALITTVLIISLILIVLSTCMQLHCLLITEIQLV